MIGRTGGQGLAFAALCLAAGCSDSNTAREPIEIGVIVSLSGDLASVGPHLQQSAQLVERQVASAGGLLDARPVRFIVEDDRTSPEFAGEVARRLVDEEGVVAIIGSLASGASIAVQEVTGPAKVPQISCCSTSPDLTGVQPETDRYFFRTVPSDLLQAVVIGRHATTLECNALAILHLNDAYGGPFGDAIRSNFEGLGGRVVTKVPFAPGRPDYSEEVAMVASAAPDCIALVAFTESGGNILRDWNALPDPPPVTWIGTDGIRDSGVVTAAGDATFVDGVIGTAPIIAPATLQYNHYASDYETVYDSPVGIFGGNQYDAAALIVLAIERAGTTNGEAVRNALFEVSNPNSDESDPFFGPGDITEALQILREGSDIDYAGASGPVDLDSHGNVVSDYEIWRYEASSSSFVRVSVIRASEISPS